MRTFCMGLVLILISLFSGCAGSSPERPNVAVSSPSPEKQDLKVVERPQKIKDLMAARGEQDQAQPTLKIAEPKAGATVGSSTVKVKLDLGGDLKGYMPGMNEETHTGNHIHVILDNQPYEAYYNLGQDFELRNVTDGDHTIRVFPSRPWHESFKNEGAFAMVSFKVKNGGFFRYVLFKKKKGGRKYSKPNALHDGEHYVDRRHSRSQRDEREQGRR